MRVLVAEDSLVMQLTLTHILEANGYQAHVVSDGHAALEFLQRQAVDLLITDISMPGMDGLALLQRLHQDERWQAIPVILITGTEEQLAPAQAVSAADVLTKPVSSWQVMNSVERVLAANPGNE